MIHDTEKKIAHIYSSKKYSSLSSCAIFRGSSEMPEEFQITWNLAANSISSQVALFIRDERIDLQCFFFLNTNFFSLVFVWFYYNSKLYLAKNLVTLMSIFRTFGISRSFDREFV